MLNDILNSLDVNTFESHEQLLEVYPLLEEAIARLGGPAATKALAFDATLTRRKNTV